MKAALRILVISSPRLPLPSWGTRVCLCLWCGTLEGSAPSPTTSLEQVATGKSRFFIWETGTQSLPHKVLVTVQWDDTQEPFSSSRCGCHVALWSSLSRWRWTELSRHEIRTSLSSGGKALTSSLRTSLVVQWLRCRSSTARGTGSIPGQGTKISYAVQRGQNIKNLKTNKNTLSLLGGNVLGGMVLGSWKRRWPSLSWKHRPGALVHVLASDFPLQGAWPPTCLSGFRGLGTAPGSRWGCTCWGCSSGHSWEFSGAFVASSWQFPFPA